MPAKPTATATEQPVQQPGAVVGDEPVAAHEEQGRSDDQEAVPVFHLQQLGRLHWRSLPSRNAEGVGQPAQSA